MNILKSKGVKFWLIVSVALIAIFTVVSILLCTTFYTVFASLLGDKRAVFSDEFPAIYKADYDSKAKTLEAANEFNEEICEEGFVLLKNSESALPVKTPASDNKITAKPRVSVFGKNSVNIAYGGSGSGGGSGGDAAKDIYDSLSAAGYETNPSLKSFYEDTRRSGAARGENSSDLDSGETVIISTAETPLSGYTDDVKGSYGDYSDMAIVVFTRIGGEGFDLPRSMKGAIGYKNEDDHYLQLDKNESDLLSEVTSSGFDKVVVILNAGTTMEVSELENNPKIDAMLWTGFPGNSGMMALGRILNGEVNPSGRTTDTWAVDFKADPTWQNFGDNLVSGGDQYTTDDGQTAEEYYFVDYEEGIYVGYRYYETRGAEDSYWYSRNVVYPMGHGLSYTTFSWEIENDAQLTESYIDGNKKYTIKVKVTNTGSAAGREVVQLYGHAPAAIYEIEKPHSVLLDFGKTLLIQPDASDYVELTFDPYYLASYDYIDKNVNDFSGYELEANDYYRLFISPNAHDTQFIIPFGVEENIQFDKGVTADSTVENRYTANKNGYFNSDEQLDEVLSRYEWDNSFPKSRTAEERNLETPDLIHVFADTTHNNPTDYSETTLPENGKSGELIFRDMVTTDGVYGFLAGETDLSKPFVSYDDKRWEQLLDQCRVSDLLGMIDNGAFKSTAISSIGKPLTNDTDGPAGFVNFMLSDGTYHGTCYYACQTVIASTWSEIIAEGFGKMVGNEGIWGADGRGNGMPYSGWYAPGANIHRSPFGGRNFEYCSEDGVLSGIIAAAQIKGAQSKGVYCYMKHFAVNDQETHRSNNGLAVWLTEQAMREIYLKPFEIAVKTGGTRAIMSSFNRIGTVWAGGDYRLLTEILREEWGFNGTVISDFTSSAYMNARQMIYAGGDLNLNNQSQFNWNDFDAASVSDVTVLRKAAKNIFYTVMNSNAMNGEIIGYKIPIWQVWLIVIDCVIAAGIVVWGFFIIRKTINRSKF